VGDVDQLPSRHSGIGFLTPAQTYEHMVKAA
jgi:hypothetical protein